MTFPMQNRGLSHLLAKGRGKGVSVISTMHPAKKTKNHLVDAQKLLSTGVQSNNPMKVDYSSDQGDNISDIFQGPGEEAEGSLIPFDIRFGATHARGELKEQPSRFGNTEMVKQSHFMHLTPMQIKKHCKELKQFMTDFYPQKEMFFASSPNTPEDQLENLYQSMMHETEAIEGQYKERKALILFPETVETLIVKFNHKVIDGGINLRPHEIRKEEQKIRISHGKALKLATEQLAKLDAKREEKLERIGNVQTGAYDTELPLTVRYSDYLTTGACQADPRSHKVEMRVNLDSLELKSNHVYRKLVDLVQSHEKETEKGYHVRWQREGRAPGLSQEVTVRYDHIDNFLHFQSKFLPTRTQNKDYLINLLARLVETATKEHDFEQNLKYEKNAVVNKKDNLAAITERISRLQRSGVNTDAHKSILKSDPWVVLNSESQHVSKMDQMAEKVKLYEQYGKMNMKMFDMKINDKQEKMRLSWTKNDKVSDYVSLAVKRNKEHGTSDSYGGAHGSFYTEMDGPNRNKGGF